MDFATTWDNANWRADWVLGSNDLATDSTLLSAVIVSLFTDRLANADDALPSDDGDRRGWWGDLALDAPIVTEERDLIGSRLWLLARAKQTNETLARAREYCEEALQWLIDDGIAGAVTVQCQWQGIGFMAISVTVSRAGSDRGAANDNYQLLWNQTAAGLYPRAA